MENVKHTLEVTVVSKEEFNSQYKAFTIKTTAQDRLFDIVSNAKNLYEAMTVVKYKGGSPITVYGHILDEMVEAGELEKLSDQEKKFVGAVVSTQMQANGWNKTGKKQKVKRVFSSGEIYIKLPSLEEQKSIVARIESAGSEEEKLALIKELGEKLK